MTDFERAVRDLIDARMILAQARLQRGREVPSLKAKRAALTGRRLRDANRDIIPSERITLKHTGNPSRAQRRQARALIKSSERYCMRAGRRKGADEITIMERVELAVSAHFNNSTAGIQARIKETIDLSAAAESNA